MKKARKKCVENKLIEKYFQSKKVKKQTTAIAKEKERGSGVARIQASK